MKSLNVKNTATLALAAVLIASCGASCGTSGGTKNLGAAPNGFVPANSISALSAAAQTAIMGTYTGTFESDDDSEPFQLVLAPATINTSSNTYVSMTLTSNGASAINDIELLDFQAAGKTVVNGETLYAFYTTPHIISGVSNTAVQLEIDLYLNSANQVDSSQSQIFIYDCGYANTCSTYGTYSQAEFLPGMVKIH